MTTFEIYRDKKREFRWRAVRKGRIVCESGESYKRLPTMRRSLTAFLASVQAGDYVTLDV